MNVGFYFVEGLKVMRLHKRSKLVYGVGINDANYNVNRYEITNGKQKLVWACPFYTKWRDMIKRCYSEIFHEKYITYKNCTVVSDWLLFSNFRSWMEQQDWEGKHLDKDLLVKGNKVYGPDTCLFLTPKVNTFLVESVKKEGSLPTGVRKHKRKNRYEATCMSTETGKSTYLGYYETIEEAHSAWLAFKLEQAYIMSGEQSDARVSQALIDYYKNYA